MKRKKVIIFSIVALIVVLSGGTGLTLGLNGYFGGGGEIATDSLTRGLIGYWDFNDGSGTTAKDWTPYANDGTFVGNTAWATGKVGSAVTLDGTNDYVLTTLNVAGQKGLTSAFWFYQTSSSTRETPLGTYTSNSDMAFDVDLVANLRQVQFNIYSMQRPPEEE